MEAGGGQGAGHSAAAGGRDGPDSFVGEIATLRDKSNIHGGAGGALAAMSASASPPLQPMCDVTSLRRRGLDLTFAMTARRDTHANVKSTTRPTQDVTCRC